MSSFQEVFFIAGTTAPSALARERASSSFWTFIHTFVRMNDIGG